MFPNLRKRERVRDWQLAVCCPVWKFLVKNTDFRRIIEQNGVPEAKAQMTCALDWSIKRV